MDPLTIAIVVIAAIVFLKSSKKTRRQVVTVAVLLGCLYIVSQFVSFSFTVSF